jgi:FAD/FMN-containing dehydrogenase
MDRHGSKRAPDHPHRAYWGDNLERVQRVKEKYDPEGVFG